MTESVKLAETLVDATEAKISAVSKLNQELGCSIANLSSIHSVVGQLRNTKDTLQQKLEFASTAAPDQISRAIQAAEEGLAKASKLQEEAQQIQQQYKEHGAVVDGLLSGVEQQLQLLQHLDTVQSYQQWVTAVQQISQEMCTLMSSNNNNNELELLRRYTQLERIFAMLNGETACANLLQYCHACLVYWHNRLLHTFSQEFEDVLKRLQYPFISTHSINHQAKPSAEQLSRLRLLTKHLLKLHSSPPSVTLSYQTTKQISTTNTCSKQQTNIISSKQTWINNSSSSDGGGELNSSRNTSEGNRNNDSNLSSEDYLSATSSPSSPNKSDKSKAESVSNATTNSNTNDSSDNLEQPAIVADFSPLLTPIKLLLNPLEIRFLYHFSGSKKTNSPSHPDWCLTRVLNWISSHAPFLADNIQPVLDESQYSHISAVTELSRGLVRLVVLKLCQDLPSVMGDEDMFCHTLQETLNFNRELRLQCDYPPSQPSILAVLTQPQVFSQWIHLERKFAVAVMDELVNMSGAWESEEQGAVSACGEQLVTLLQGITDRYKSLPQPGHRLQFLDVQLDVLDEYRVRSVQLSRDMQQSPVTSHYSAILNTLHHVAETLAIWGDMPFFLELQVYRCQQRNAEAAVAAKMAAADIAGSAVASVSVSSKDDILGTVEGSVFDECVSLYCHVQQEMLDTTHQHVISEVRARFMPYRKDKWFLEPNKSASAVRCCDVSGSLCPLLEVLARQLHCLRLVLATPLFTQLWHNIARDIDKFLFEDLVLDNHFSDVGVAQFEHDMTRALFPMFSEFSSRPESHFAYVSQSLSLLTMPLAPALLLRDTLRQCLQGDMASTLRLAVTGSSATRPRVMDNNDVPGVVAPETALADHGVTRVLPRYALRVLNARNNITNL